MRDSGARRCGHAENGFFGVVHGALLVGEWHWVIQVLHLLVGMLLLGQAEQLGRIAQAGRTARTGGVPAGPVGVPLSVA